MRVFRLKTIILLSLAGFLVSMIAITLHHHDNAYLFPSCSLCKVKTVFPGTVHKIKADTDSLALSPLHSLTSFFLPLSCILTDQITAFISFQTIETYPNKASPFFV